MTHGTQAPETTTAASRPDTEVPRSELPSWEIDEIIDTSHRQPMPDAPMSDTPSSRTPETMDVEAIRARLNALTQPWPWSFGSTRNREDFERVDSWNVYGCGIQIFASGGSRLRAEAEFTANAPADIAALLSRLETLEKNNEKLYRTSLEIGNTLNVEIRRLESENARMAEVLEAAKSLCVVLNVRRMSIAEKAAWYTLTEKLKAARASRTQSPDANKEKK